MLARNGAVTLDTNTITRPSCVTGPGGGGPTGPTPSTDGGGIGLGRLRARRPRWAGRNRRQGGPGDGGAVATALALVPVPATRSRRPPVVELIPARMPGSNASPPSRLWLAAIVLGGVGGVATVVGWRRRQAMSLTDRVLGLRAIAAELASCWGSASSAWARRGAGHREPAVRLDGCHRDRRHRGRDELPPTTTADAGERRSVVAVLAGLFRRRSGSRPSDSRLR